jgi:hypothetical protein
MDRPQALELCRELRQLVGDAPGADDAAMRRAEQIEFAFSHDERSNVYLKEKVVAVVSYIGEWCSVRKWQKYGADPRGLRGILMNDLAKLEMAVEQAYGPEDSA